MNFVKIGNIYLNPAQVIRVETKSDGSDSYVQIESTDKIVTRVYSRTIVEVVGLLNEGL